jgi:hypothetical protein
MHAQVLIKYLAYMLLQHMPIGQVTVARHTQVL